MAKRFTDTELWDKEWFMLLTPTLKCLVKFVRDKCDLSGVWSPNWVAAKMYVGDQISENDLLEIDGGNQFSKLENGKILCVDFIEFQYGKLSQKSPVHRKVLATLENHGLKYPTLLIPYKYPINSLKEKDKEEEEEKEEEKDSAAMIEKKVFEIKNSQKWIEEVTIKLKSIVHATQNFLDEFLSKESLKSDFLEKSLNETKDHFVNWYTLELKKIKTNGSTANNQRIQRNNELKAFSESMDNILTNGQNHESGTNSTINAEAVIIESSKIIGGAES